MNIYIARDKDETLWLHFRKPTLCEQEWVSSDYKAVTMSLFPEVTFENSPQKVELKIVKENINYKNYGR